VLKQRKRKDILYFPSAGDIQPLPRRRDFTMCAVAPEEKCHNNKCPLPLLLAFIAEHDVIWYGTSLWSVCISCPDYVPSQSLDHPSLLVRGGMLERQP